MLPAGPATYGHSMEMPMTFLDCPAWLDDRGTSRCGLPALVRNRFTAESTDGPLECAMIRCPLGHVFNAPIEFLTLADAPAPAPASAYGERR